MLGAIHIYLVRGRFASRTSSSRFRAGQHRGGGPARARNEESVANDLIRLKAGAPGYDELVGNSAPMQELKAKIARVAQAGGCVLVRGESGTGKELGRAGDPSSQPASRSAATLRQLRGDSGRPDGKSALRPKKGPLRALIATNTASFSRPDLGTLFWTKSAN